MDQRYAYMHINVEGGCGGVAFYCDHYPEFDEVLAEGDEIFCLACGVSVLQPFARVPEQFLIEVQ